MNRVLQLTNPKEIDRFRIAAFLLRRAADRRGLGANRARRAEEAAIRIVDFLYCVLPAAEKQTTARVWLPIAGRRPNAMASTKSVHLCSIGDQSQGSNGCSTLTILGRCRCRPTICEQWALPRPCGGRPASAPILRKTGLPVGERHQPIGRGTPAALGLDAQ
jgi:hypothetical protein